MKKTFGLLILAMTLTSTQAFDLRYVADGIVDQATRKSSCTYMLTIKGAAVDKAKEITESSYTVDEACALAKARCNEVGKKEGFLGRHKCDLLNGDSGGVVTRVIEGDIPNSKPSGTQQCNKKLIKRENEKLRDLVAKKDREISRLEGQIQDRAGTNIELENISLDKEVRSLRNENRNLSKRNKELQEKVSSFTQDDRTSFIASCGKAFPYSNPNRKKCLEIKPSHAVAMACFKAFEFSDLDRVECLKLDKEVGLINNCYSAFEFSDTDRIDCIKNN